MAFSSSTSSSTKPKWIYDVFLSFRGVDTRDGDFHGNITRRIYSGLTNAGIHVFMDEKELQRGENISRSLLQAIEGSQIAIVILSENYASSTWCLDELAKIMECQRTLGQVVLPVFYYIDPSDIRHLNGSYGRAMDQHVQRFTWSSVRVRQWKQALHEVANIAGWHTAQTRNSDVMFEELVEAVTSTLDDGQLHVADHPVGIESRVHYLTIEWLEKERSQNVLIIGLCGMGGIGKTTIAKAIYNKLGQQFKRRSFLKDIREISKQDSGLVILQKQLISDIVKTEVFKIPDIERGKTIIQRRLPHIATLIVLDDVDSPTQLKALCESRKWFCPGSVIIITTRDLRLLNVLEADHKYIVREMDETESLELFSWHAFKQAAPSQNFIELSRDIAAYCGGLPLALEILGSYLFGRTIEEWKGVLSKLERIPNEEIQEKLKISFDGLNNTEKDIFLDICCFFIYKDRNYVAQILDGCEFNAENGIQILIERSLIKVSRNNKLEMHDLLRDMGREIIRENSPKDPEERSRLWFYKEVIEVLTEHTGTKAIEGIALKLTRTHRKPSIESTAFEAMKRLRLLQLDYVNLDGDYKYISKKLRWLCWREFPLEYTPHNLCQENLVAIDFKYSSLKQLWKEPQLLPCLKTLILSHSPHLTQTPDFTKLPNLEKLILKGCPSLILVHQNIGDLKNLLLVNLKDCKCLRDLPRSIYKLKSLKTLILSGCSMIDHLEEDFEQMESLTTLMADNTAITQVPISLARLEGFVHGYVSLCGYEGRAQDILPSLVWSWMSPTNIAQSCSHTFLLSISSIVFSAVQNGSFRGLSPLLDHLSKLRSVWEECRPQFQFNGKMATLLDALYGTNFMELASTPTASQIPYMEASVSSDGDNQVHIARPADSFNSLLIKMRVCDKVDILQKKIVQGWNYSGWDDSHLPGDQDLDWFIFKGDGRSIIFKVPQVVGSDLKAMVFSVVYSCCMDNMTSQFLINILLVNYTKDTVHHHKRDLVTCQEDEEWQGIISTIEPGDFVEFVFSMGSQLTVNKIIAYLVYDGF